jgi:hypothetical protein
MNKKQKIYLWIGIIGILLAGLFPPWQHEKVAYSIATEPAGISFILNPPSLLGDSKGYGIRIDIATLLIEWVLISVVVTGLIVTAKNEKKL